MLCFPNAKINLGLQVLRKRDDGFHDIESVLYPIPLEDVLEIRESPSLSFQSTGLEIPGKPAQNLCLKAYELLNDQFKIPPVEIHLRKNISMGGGLGGGSSDGAHMLRLLNNYFKLDISTRELEIIASKLGSDCPFFIQNSPALATGRGTELSTVQLSLKGRYLLLLFPEIHSSTAEAYGGITPLEGRIPVSEILLKDISEWKESLENDFETTIFSLYPQLGALKNQFYENGALYASMTGSGSVVYGIFDHKLELSLEHHHQWLAI